MENELKTSAEWQRLKPDVKVLDPDGWDRQNWEYSWGEELIDESEYHRRRMWSTCINYGLQEKLKENNK